MKNVIKSILTVMAIAFTITTNAQETEKNYDQGFRLGFGISGGLPLDDPYDFNLGADARLQYDLSKKYLVTFLCLAMITI